MSLLLVYHQSQVVAQQTLAEKMALPPEVMLQDFSTQDHSNMLNEARLLGEAALDRAVMMNIGTEDKPNWVQVIPFYPVSVKSLITAFQYLENSTIQDMPTETKQRLAASAWQIQKMQDMPMAMLLVETGMSIEQTIMHNFIGEGKHGPLVAITGSTVRARTITAQAVEAFIVSGTKIMSDMPMVLPYPNGQRVSAPSQDYSLLRSIFNWGFAISAFMALYCTFGLAPRRRKREGEAPALQPVEPLVPATNIFADIRTQEELSHEEEVERAAAPKRRVLSRISYLA